MKVAWICRSVCIKMLHCAPAPGDFIWVELKVDEEASLVIISWRWLLEVWYFFIEISFDLVSSFAFATTRFLMLSLADHVVSNASLACLIASSQASMEVLCSDSVSTCCYRYIFSLDLHVSQQEFLCHFRYGKLGAASFSSSSTMGQIIRSIPIL